MFSDTLLLGRSRRPGVRWGILDARGPLFASSPGDSEISLLDLVARSVYGVLGSMFSFLLGVDGRGGDNRRIGDPSLEGELDFAGDWERIGDWPRIGVMGM